MPLIMKRSFGTVAVIALLTFAGCAGVAKVRYSPLLEVDRLPRAVDEVEAFITQKPDRPYQEMGILTYRAGTAEKYVNVVQYMRGKAAELGADGVIMMGATSGPSMPIGHVIATLKDYQAMAILYKNQ